MTVDHPSFSRRQVLRVAGTAGATMLVAGVGVGGYRVYDTAVLHPGTGQAYDAWLQWDQASGPLGAVGAAILAANPHNTQPWFFAVSATTVDVFVDRDAISAASTRCAASSTSGWAARSRTSSWPARPAA